MKLRKNRATRVARIGLLIALLLVTGYRLSRSEPLRGQSETPDAASVHLERVIGIHSASLQDAYADRSLDPKQDRLSPEKRDAKESRLHHLSPHVQDPGLLVNGRQHDYVFTHWDLAGEIKALPTDSNVVCIATLTDTHGFVAKDHDAVYTDYTFTIESILKSDDTSLSAGGEVTAIRLGARVHFSSGHITDYVVDAHGLPKVDHKYILFLSRPADAREDNYGISTAYEILDSHVYALDQIKPYTVFEGQTEQDFMSALNAALSSNSAAAQ